jgi:hypothetical protein
MKIGKLLFILGIILIIYSVVSGFYFHFSFHDGDYEYTNGYSLKAGTLIVGIALMVLSKRIEK